MLCLPGPSLMQMHAVCALTLKMACLLACPPARPCLLSCLQAHRKEGYAWWVQRFQRTLAMYDETRVRRAGASNVLVTNY